MPFNIQDYGFQETNEQLNLLMDATDVFISLSGAEGFDLPCLNNLCLGKQSVILNAHAHKSYATAKNSILVEPNGTTPIEDGIFFQKDGLVNVGNMYSFTQEAAWAAMDEAVARVKKGVVNKEGKKLAKVFSVEKTVDKLLSFVS